MFGGGLPSDLRIGAAYRHQPWRAAFGAEFSRISYGVAGQAGVSETGLGAEWRAKDYLALRAGVGGIGNQVRLTFGLSAFYNDWRLDYAFGTHPVGLTNRFSMSYMFGQSEGAEDRVPAAVEKAPAGNIPAPQSPQPGRSADSIFQESSALYAAGNYAGAWGKAAEALKIDPRHWQSWQMIGNCQYALGDKAGAMTSYRASLQLNPDNPGLKAWLDQQTQ
jgi:tetratricopeptide (TPR) repeat protein